jgi:hypothetical protein
MIESFDFRLTKMPLNNGAGWMPALGFGTLIPDPAVTITATRDALNAGFRHFDCAERYRNKQEVGEALQVGLTVAGIARNDYDGAVTAHVDKRRRGRTSQARWRWMKRRAAVEPSIGHLKNEHRLERNRLKGTAGNEINAILAAAAMNFQKLLRAFGRTFLYCLMQLWNGLIDLKGPEDRNAQLRYA